MRPWNLTPREFEAVTAFVETGNQKLAARRLGVEPKTINTFISRAVEKSGLANSVLLALSFDRLNRGVK